MQIGVALIPALATLWPRLRMPEGKKYLESREIGHGRPRSMESGYSLTSRRKEQRRSKGLEGSSTEVIVSDGTDVQE